MNRKLIEDKEDEDIIIDKIISDSNQNVQNSNQNFNSNQTQNQNLSNLKNEEKIEIEKIEIDKNEEKTIEEKNAIKIEQKKNEKIEINEEIIEKIDDKGMGKTIPVEQKKEIEENIKQKEEKKKQKKEREKIKLQKRQREKIEKEKLEKEKIEILNLNTKIDLQSFLKNCSVNSFIQYYNKNKQKFKKFRFESVKKTIIIGNTSKFVPKEKREEHDSYTHKWQAYCRAPKNENLNSFVKYVRFVLDPSYAPNTDIDVTTYPFSISKRGWGEFTVRVILFFSNGENSIKNASFDTEDEEFLLNNSIELNHDLKLDKENSGKEVIHSETVYEIEILRTIYVTVE